MSRVVVQTGCIPRQGLELQSTTIETSELFPSRLDRVARYRTRGKRFGYPRDDFTACFCAWSSTDVANGAVTLL